MSVAGAHSCSHSIESFFPRCRNGGSGRKRTSGRRNLGLASVTKLAKTRIRFSLLRNPARRMLSAHNSVTNVQKRLGNWCYTGQGSCRVCGAFWDLQLEQSDTCSTAQATRGHFCLRSCRAGGNQARGRGSYHRATGAYLRGVEAGRLVHHHCYTRTQRGTRRLRGILHRSSGARQRGSKRT